MTTPPNTPRDPYDTASGPPGTSSSARTYGGSAAAAGPNPAHAGFAEAKAAAGSAASTISDRLAEIREYAGYYAATKTDAIKVKVTWLAVYAALGMVAAVVGVAALATAGVLLVRGVAGALGALFGGRDWLGELVTGLGLLLLLGIGAVVVLKVLSGTFKRKLMAKYEQRHHDQRERFGADVLQRSREAVEQS